MATYIPPERNNFLQQVLPLIQVLGLLKGQTTSEADALIGTRRPGATVGEVGLTPKQQKAKYGKVMKPTDLTVQPTAEQVANNNLLDFLAKADANTINTISASMASRLAGVPQITTGTGLTNQGRASEIASGTAITEAETKGAVAKNNQQLVGEALKSLATWKPETRSAFAERQTLGTTQQEQANAVNAERVKAEVQRSILQAAADPEKSDLNKALKTFTGVGLGGAMAAAGLGLTSVLTSIADMNTMNIRTGQSLAAELEKQMNQADTQWAQDVAKNLGGTASPRAVLNWKRARESGSDKLPAGVSPALNAALETAQNASYRAFLVEQSQKGDVEAQTLMQLIHAATTVKDENTLKAISQLSARYMARSIMNSRVGLRPDDPTQGAQWDAAAKAIESRTPQLTPHSILGFDFGVDLKQPTGRPTASQFPPSLPPNPAIPNIPAGATAPQASAAPANPTGLNFQELDPADQQSVAAFLQALREYSTQQQPKKP